MGDLEERLRTAVVRRSEGFDPSPDLPDRIHARVRHRRRARRLVRGSVAALAAAAAVAAVVLVVPGGGDEGSIRVTGRGGVDVQDPTDEPSRTTTTQKGPWDGPTSGPSTVPSPSSSPPSSTTTSTAATRPLDMLTRQGVGPITAGMTLRQAQEAAGVAVTPVPGGSATCIEAQIEGLQATGLVLVVEPAPPGADVMGGIVRATAGSILTTEEGIRFGLSRDEVVGILGQPTRTEDLSVELAPAVAELLVFEAGGAAYGVVMTDGQVYSVQSGHPDWISDVDGCP